MAATPPSAPDAEMGASVPKTPRHAVLAALQANRRRYRDGLVAVVLVLVAQLLICGLQQVTASIDDFPAAILAMVLVAAILMLAVKLVPGLDQFYLHHLRAPTDLVNRHMSVGFTVPLAMILDGPMSSPRNIGIIIAGFVATGMLNTFAVFGMTVSVHAALLALPVPRFGRGLASPPTQGIAYPVLAPPTLRPLDLAPQSNTSSTSSTPSATHSATHDADAATLHEIAESPSGQPPAQECSEKASGASLSLRLPSCTSAVLVFAATNPVLAACLVAIPTVGVPVSAATGHDAALDTFVLFALWTGMLVLQATLKAPTGPLRRLAPALRNVVATLLNAVLWASLGAIAYLAAKSAVRQRPLDAALAEFSAGLTLADVIKPGPGVDASRFGAGDMARSVLDAGIVVWGLKLFECRAQLLSRAGITVLIVAAVMAVGNIVCGPLLVHAMALAPPSKVLSFAARSVTLALAGPAMANLGGDVGLNAAMVVFNGIVFQVAMGLGLYHWAGVQMARGADACKDAWGNVRFRKARITPVDSALASPAASRRTSSDGPGYSGSDADAADASARSPSSLSTDSADSADSALSSGSDEVLSKAALARASVPLPYPPYTGFAGQLRGGGSVFVADSNADRPSTVAGGMTIGINAAAMGTAYLYEDGSRAAPYSALAMTVFGVMTVVFTCIQPLAAWVVASVQ